MIGYHLHIIVDKNINGIAIFNMKLGMVQSPCVFTFKQQVLSYAFYVDIIFKKLKTLHKTP